MTGEMFLELSLLDEKMIGMPPSLIGAGVSYLCNKMWYRHSLSWPPAAEQHSGYSKRNASTCGRMIFDHIVTQVGPQRPYEGSMKKWCSKTACFIGEYVSGWSNKAPIKY
eukprot:GHVL01010802.1.p2 GENE.GHVL01010802.1~~GHVL01010802.1.p2  ORF type:complete len:110 (-),score=16.15 GHVL01010802.1:134-463(-)